MILKAFCNVRTQVLGYCGVLYTVLILEKDSNDVITIRGNGENGFPV